ncbi:uncharacterized protein N0V89_001311 [Didymosphaeria variabile]|uniref:Xylanolytic transcriptional activator regulatory domain-containing protein n=1 Tax=Didymosphaeria variabile TaxID=1932322 RepID=A0A9W8XW13_9PLEO|nr:uncharacterized protein N0V89_001311 [Didymosphaeria variabile]KAJ4360744.1 hypothetical protein N0V89_001311 [Didymosphaeria variabile]
MVENAAGQSPFTDDPRRHKIVEGQFSLPAGARHTHLLPDQRTARVLVDAFFINTHGLLQVFERHKFLEKLETCYSDPLSTEPSWLCILNLVFAIGLTMATPLSGSSEALIIDKLRSEHLDRAEVFYLNAKSLNDPMTGFEDQDFWSVQALLLMSVYMLAKSKRNTAFALLGMAARSAQALGLHREETLVIFGPEEQKARKNLWRSLFVIDRLLACLLGRPTAISESDCSGDNLRPAEAAAEASNLKANFSETGAFALEAAVRSCSAIGLILKKVYQQRKISTRLAQEIADISGPDLYSLGGQSKPPSLSNVFDLSGLDTTRVPSLYSEESGTDEQIDFDALWAWPSNTPAVGSPRNPGDAAAIGLPSTQGMSDNSVPLFSVVSHAGD